MTLTPIAAWILTFLFHSTVLTVLALLCLRFLRGPAGKALLLRGALLGAFVTATVAGLASPGQKWNLPAMEATGPIISVSATAQPVAIDFAPLAEASPTEWAAPAVQAATSSNLSTLAWTWIPISLCLFSVFAVLHFVQRERAAWRLLRHRESIHDESIWRAARKLVVHHRLSKVLRLTKSAHMYAPMAIGRNEIVLPDRALKELGPPQLEALLAHEVAHLVRRDPLWLGACRIAVALAWFQPLLGLLLRRLEEQTELAADDWAAHRVRDGLSLALCLERVGTWLAESPAPASAAAMTSSGSSLFIRVERLLAKRQQESRRSLLAVSGAVALALGVFACAGPAVTADNASIETESAASSPTRMESQGGLSIPIFIKVPGPNQKFACETTHGAFADASELERWLRSQIDNRKDASVRLYPTKGTRYMDVVPAIDAAVRAGYTDISFEGMDADKRDQWKELYSTNARPATPGGPSLSKELPDLKMEIRLNADGRLTSFRTLGGTSLGLKKDDPRVSMLNRIHEEENMSIPAVLAVPMNALVIRVDASTHFSHVQRIMEKCASQEIQLADIHVRLNAEPDYLTDFSLPVDLDVIPEEVEEGTEGNLAGHNLREDSHVVIRAKDGYAHFTADDLTLTLLQATTLRELSEYSVDQANNGRMTLRIPIGFWPDSTKLRLTDSQTMTVRCDPDVPMAKLLPVLHAWTSKGVKLQFTASMPKGR